jgi:hypothetical protein
MRNMQFRDGVSKLIAAKLSELQGSRTDAEMGHLLGVTRVHWAHIKAGRREPSYALAKRASLIFPELSLIVIRDWTAGPSEAVS